MANKDKKLTFRPRNMYETDIIKYQSRLNVIKRKDGYTTEKKQLKRVIESLELVIINDNSVPVDKNGFSLS